MSESPADWFSLSGKTFLITGGTRGIGRAISLRFARAGAKVVASHVRNLEAAEELKALAEKEGLKIVVVRGDLTNDRGLEEVSRAVESCGPSLSGLVHCAATGVHRSFEELTARHLAWTLDLNVTAFFRLTQLLRPRFESGSSILAVTSWGASRAFPYYAAVGASKGALDALARHLAAELAPKGIRVNILCPGTIVTEAWKAFPDADARIAASTERTPAGRLTTADEVAAGAHFLCSPAASGIVGHTLVIDGGASIVG
jgi:NAD(P)-dependent dehydrogenase (short-subunit alcohol dehydrogenase family)